MTKRLTPEREQEIRELYAFNNEGGHGEGSLYGA